MLFFICFSSCLRDAESDVHHCPFETRNPSSASPSPFQDHRSVAKVSQAGSDGKLCMSK